MTAPAINLTSDMPLPREIEQQDTMRAMRFRDQHNRPYSTVVSKETMVPCTSLTPVGWDAPLPMMVPPTKYFTFDPNETGRTVIDYDRWIRDLGAAERDYRDWVLQVAKQQFGGAALQKIESRDRGLQALCGPAPQSVEYVKAMKAGNKWALGIARPDGTPYPRPQWADEYFDGWIFESTFEGSDIETNVTADMYPDVDDDVADDVARFAASSEYADIEDDVDPSVAPTTQPLPRKRGRPPKER